MLGEHLLTNISESRISEIRDKLMIDLSPISYGTFGLTIGEQIDHA